MVAASSWVALMREYAWRWPVAYVALVAFVIYGASSLVDDLQGMASAGSRMTTPVRLIMALGTSLILMVVARRQHARRLPPRSAT